jgi:3-hydroxymyristoyl/3-hydroxydecanoyl-(acyl carrier protein) dehydratase
LDNFQIYNQSLIEIIIPHRPPFLMVDSITFYKSGKSPTMIATYMVKGKEPLYHFSQSDAHWPSIYVIEGLGQACNLMIVITALEKELMKTGLNIGSIDEVLKALTDEEPDETTAFIKDSLQKRMRETYSSIGFLGSADMEITGHAMQGQVVSYEVQQNQAFGSLFHSTVKAYANTNLIACGTMVNAGRKG